ncbi:MAG TPA: ribonuclease H-like domain-containing protein, partial [Solirubrobacteraceae bacterium]
MGTVALANSPAYRQRRRKRRNPQNLTSIWGLGARHAKALESIGIPDCKTLMHCDPHAVTAALREERLATSLNQVSQWRSHAESLTTKRPVFFGDPPPVGEDFIALDLEYNSFKPHIWLIGLLVVQAGSEEHIWLWADDHNQEHANLYWLARVMAAHPDLPILTWAGASADIPQLQNAAERHDALATLTPLQSRHVDLFRHARNSVRLPVPELSLGPFADYLRIPKTSPVRNGLQAQMQYEIYQGLRDPARKAARKTELIAYNYDDLRALSGVLKIMLHRPASAGVHPPG